MKKASTKKVQVRIPAWLAQAKGLGTGLIDRVVVGEIERETAKAILLVTERHGGYPYDRSYWLPKSQVRVLAPEEELSEEEMFLH